MFIFFKDSHTVLTFYNSDCQTQILSPIQCCHLLSHSCKSRRGYLELSPSSSSSSSCGTKKAASRPEKKKLSDALRPVPKFYGLTLVTFEVLATIFADERMDALNGVCFLGGGGNSVFFFSGEKLLEWKMRR